MTATMIDGREVDLDLLKERKPDCIEMCVEVLYPTDGGGSYVYVKRYKTPLEIQSELNKALDKSVCICGHEWKPRKYDSPCPVCKNTEDRMELIDEYDSCCHFGESETIPIAPRDWCITSIAVWCEPGGNEGYSVWVTVHLRGRYGSETKTVDVYRIKSFQGMEHVYGLVKRIMQLTGVWTPYS